MYGLSPLPHRNYIAFGSRNRHDVRCCKSENIERFPNYIDVLCVPVTIYFNGLKNLSHLSWFNMSDIDQICFAS